MSTSTVQLVSCGRGRRVPVSHKSFGGKVDMREGESRSSREFSVLRTRSRCGKGDCSIISSVSALAAQTREWIFHVFLSSGDPQKCIICAHASKIDRYVVFMLCTVCKLVYLVAPSLHFLSQISPRSGPLGGGTVLRISGQWLGINERQLEGNVLINDVPCSKVRILKQL